MKKIIARPQPLRFFYRPHTADPPRWRVWRSDWSGDSFEILTPEQFTEATGFLQRFGFAFLDAEIHDLA